jgi:hypothetical protein
MAKFESFKHAFKKDVDLKVEEHSKLATEL